MMMERLSKGLRSQARKNFFAEKEIGNHFGLNASNMKCLIQESTSCPCGISLRYEISSCTAPEESSHPFF
jgi:hypothetical protein